MREIKFRAFYDGEMFFQKDQSDEFVFELAEDGPVLVIHEQYFESGSGEAEESWRYQTVEAKFTQYTGLKDKNGKEIYEGDIVRSEECMPCSIQFHQGAFTLGCDWPITYYMDCHDTGWTLEKIGNIYENPELLK